jgi:hypothetical protein
VYDDADDHHLERKRKFHGTRQRHHDAVHEEVDSDAKQSTRDHGVLQKEREPAARAKVDSSGGECDEKVAEKSEHSGRDTAFEGPRTQHTRGDSLQQAQWRAPKMTIDDESGGNVQCATRKSAPQNCQARAEILQLRIVQGLDS